MDKYEDLMAAQAQARKEYDKLLEHWRNKKKRAKDPTARTEAEQQMDKIKKGRKDFIDKRAAEILNNSNTTKALPSLASAIPAGMVLSDEDRRVLAKEQSTVNDLKKIALENAGKAISGHREAVSAEENASQRIEKAHVMSNGTFEQAHMDSVNFIRTYFGGRGTEDTTGSSATSSVTGSRRNTGRHRKRQEGVVGKLLLVATCAGISVDSNSLRHCMCYQLLRGLYQQWSPILL